MMQRQMELFGDGGLKDEGGMIDSESGNEVPIGGTRKGVRDDIPANISEGEFIFPEDVTRYIGLDKLMQLRQEAKMGLKKMEAMGQMGNSDEATMEDDLPFGMADIIVVGDSDEPMEFANGGFVPVKNYEPGGLTTGTTGSTRVNQGVDNTIVVDDTVANTGTQSATRSLVGETTTIPRTTVKFKDFMGEALIELRQFINEAGNIITLPFQGGVMLPSYTIPEGYTAVVTEEAVDTGDEDADAIIEDANNAVKEARENKDFVEPPAKPPVEWSTLPTNKLIEESNKLTGVSSTIANGIMLFLGPVGMLGSFLMRRQNKTVAAEIATRIAKGGLSAAEVKSLTATMEALNSSKSFSLLDKAVDLVGGLLDKPAKEISAVKKTSINIEQNVANQVEEDLTGDLGPVQSVTTANNPNLVVPESYTPTALGLQQQLAMNDQTDMRERQSPVDMGITKLDDAQYRSRKSPEAYARMRNKYSQELSNMFDDNDDYRNYEADYAAKNSLNNQVEAGDFDGTILAPGEGKLSTPVSASVSAQTRNAFPTDPRLSITSTGLPAQTETAGTYSTPNVDKNGKSHPNAFAVRAANAQIDAAAAIEKAKNSLAMTPPNFNLEINPITGERAIPGVDSNYTLESAPAFAPKLGSYQKTDADTVAEARRLIDKYDSDANARIDDGTSMEFAKASMDNAKANAASVDPVIEQQSYTSIPKSVPGQMTTDQSYVPPVANQMEQAFAPYDAERMMKINEIPTTTTPNLAPYDAERMMKINEIPTTTTPNLVPDVNTVSTVPKTFNQAFATNREAGNKTFDYEGKSYTTQTAEEVSPKTGTSSNSIYQSFLNLVTPFDNKEYQDGKLIETAASKSDSGTSSSRRTAKVKSGDTLSKIAKDNNTTVAALKAANNIADVNKIQAGASLVIPGSSSSQSVDTESSASSAIDKWQNATEVVQSLGSDPDPADWHAAIQAQSQASVEATAAIKARTAARNEAEENNKYKGGLLSKPKKKTKATTKKRGLAARK